jgi:hypothetical protein
LQDNEEGDIIRWDSDLDYYALSETTLSYNLASYPGDFTAYREIIRNHIKFDPQEAALVQPRTQIGKWG